jgi:hypothetical protein
MWSTITPANRVIKPVPDSNFRPAWMTTKDVGWVRCEDLIVDSEDHQFYIWDGTDISYKRTKGQMVRISMGRTNRIYAVCFDPTYHWKPTPVPNEDKYIHFDENVNIFPASNSRIYFRQAKRGEKA